MRIISMDPRTDLRWQQLATSHPLSSIFHAPAWIQAITDTYGFEAGAYVAVDEQDRPLAGIPYCRVADMQGERIVSLPFSDFCDPLVSTSEEWQALSGKLLEHGLPVANRSLHNTIPLNDPRLPQTKRAKWHGLNLQPDLDTIWQNIHAATRRGINKAQREGVTVQYATGTDELRTFFETLFRLRKYKYRLLAQPYTFFENIWRHLIEKEQGVLMLAIFENEIIATSMFLEWNDKIYYKFNASSPKHLQLRVNDVLLWESIQYGKGKGYTQLDFGLSDWDQDGLVEYKRKFGTEEKTISFLQHTPDGLPNDQTKHVRSLLPKLTDLFTDPSVPDAVSEQAGETLYRFFT